MCKEKSFIPCRTCPTRDVSKASFMEGYYFDEVDGCKVLVECKCHKKWRETRELERKLVASNLITEYGFDDYKGTESIEDVKALKEFVNHFDKYSKSMLYIYGKNGTQKTSMAMAAGKELVGKGYKVQYVLMNNLLTSLVTDFDKKDQEVKDIFIKKCEDCDLLIIDEAFDKEKSVIYKSGYQVPFLDNFLRERFDINKKAVLFISNHQPSEITTQGFSGSLQSLVERNTKRSLLIFKDVYTENANQIDRLGLFRRDNNV